MFLTDESLDIQNEMKGNESNDKLEIFGKWESSEIRHMATAIIEWRNVFSMKSAA